jgi:hypothetical protein
MEGAALAKKQDMDLAMFTAWHTAVFALNGYGGKLKGKKLSDYLTQKPEHNPSHSKAIAFFHSLQARGVPVKITRNEIN